MSLRAFYLARSANAGLSGPTVVHCSAGIGRTGTFVAASIVRVGMTFAEVVREPLVFESLVKSNLEQRNLPAGYIMKPVSSDGWIQLLNRFSVSNLVLMLRSQRNHGMVQTEDQFVFIHRIIIDELYSAVRSEPSAAVRQAEHFELRKRIESTSNFKSSLFNSSSPLFPSNSQQAPPPLVVNPNTSHINLYPTYSTTTSSYSSTTPSSSSGFPSMGSPTVPLSHTTPSQSRGFGATFSPPPTSHDMMETNNSSASASASFGQSHNSHHSHSHSSHSQNTHSQNTHAHNSHNSYNSLDSSMSLDDGFTNDSLSKDFSFSSYSDVPSDAGSDRGFSLSSTRSYNSSGQPHYHRSSDTISRPRPRHSGYPTHETQSSSLYAHHTDSGHSTPSANYWEDLPPTSYPTESAGPPSKVMRFTTTH
eukprot:TRINITY_DN8855_c0_g1_i1.p1 TRINITY_DN8855_c0_g1~~TRINITY_DN8855_c0_g1_i1.p1  ORF type:complete len:419 (-),score=33.28 TRINITY_DN8855_c0_g1_i1:76-1332(-)